MDIPPQSSQMKLEYSDNIQCFECGQIFLEWPELRNHRASTHKLYTCKSCPKEETSLMDFEYHLQIHGGMKVFKCIICNENFSFLFELNDHLPQHLPEFKDVKEHENTNSLFSIFEVKTENSDEDGTNCNRNVVDDMSTDKGKNIDSNEVVKLPESKEIEQGYREITAKSVDSSETKSPANQKIQISEKPPTKRRGRPPKIRNEEELPKSKMYVKCPKCPHITNNSTYLRYHMQKHSNFRPYECAHCGAKYKMLKSLESHLIIKHIRSEKTEICNVCGKAFYMRLNLQLHMKIHDTHRERYPCTVCGKTYSTKGALSLHMDKHTSNNPEKYPCPKCGKVFDFRVSMIYHHRRHSAVKKFACDWESCDYRTSVHSRFLAHKRTHTGEKPYQCSKCNSSFITNAALKHHFIQVHQPPTLQCSFCDKAFAIKPSLNDHIRRVHLERTEPCPVCNKKYGSKGDVARHMKDCHSGPRVYKKKMRKSQN
ncbi:gastrula zinc finger protein XlCGF26.1-like [Phlebotomus papatasi]|uniref:gastrula zinc finger protein XlCGF26.1-like n=1 Tax=Phlebotomus papatasi TaxID=29031 RepID=UPI00248445A5|nr:gastrula zinc finger protein XlCGF26.1-like [Phlebotomus papatasi]